MSCQSSSAWVLSLGGPPRSRHWNVNLGSSPASSIDQRIATRPPGVEYAPYLVALVQSSWMNNGAVDAFFRGDAPQEGEIVAGRPEAR